MTVRASRRILLHGLGYFGYITENDWVQNCQGPENGGSISALDPGQKMEL
jgi:hypothetical protein